MKIRALLGYMNTKHLRSILQRHFLTLLSICKHVLLCNTTENLSQYFFQCFSLGILFIIINS